VDESAHRLPQGSVRPIPRAEPVYQPASAPLNDRSATFQDGRYPAPHVAPVVVSQEVRPTAYVLPVVDSVIREPGLLPNAGAVIRQPLIPQGRILGITARR
jgi:hypothetical protein